MVRAALADLVDRIGADGAVCADETLDLRRTVFVDGAVSRAEAEALIGLARTIANDSPAFTVALLEAVGDHVLATSGHVDPADVDWLCQRVQSLDAGLAAAILVDVLRRAQAAPTALAEEARAAVLAHLSGRVLTRGDVDQVRTLLAASAGCGGVHVTLEEVQFLFALDAACDGRDNDPSWGDVFERSVLNHVMGQRAPQLLDYTGMRDRRAWLEADSGFSPFGFLARALRGGPAGVLAALREPSAVEAFESHYAERVAHAEEDARLTLQETTMLVVMVRADGKRTQNEQRLLDAVARIEAEARG